MFTQYHTRSDRTLGQSGRRPCKRRSNGCHVTGPIRPPDNDEPRLRIWRAPIRLARGSGLSLVADDAALRAVARSEGVVAFGSLPLLEPLVQDGMLPDRRLKQSYRRLMAVRAADCPCRRLCQIARDEAVEPEPGV